jgi:predicted transcriptional regulator
MAARALQEPSTIRITTRLAGSMGRSLILASASLNALTAADVLSSDPITGQRTASPGTSLAEAVAEMILRGLDCLPIMQDEKPVGILTSTDLNVVLEELLRFFSAGASVPALASAR